MFKIAKQMRKERALRLQKVPERLIALVMALYSNARSRVRTLAGTSDEFGKEVGVHQRSPLSSLLFVVVTGFSLEAGNRQTPAATFDISAAYFC